MDENAGQQTPQNTNQNPQPTPPPSAPVFPSPATPPPSAPVFPQQPVEPVATQPNSSYVASQISQENTRNPSTNFSVLSQQPLPSQANIVHQEGVSPAVDTADEGTSAGSPRLTIDDLYGPSQVAQTNQPMQQQSAPAQAIQSATSSQPESLQEAPPVVSPVLTQEPMKEEQPSLGHLNFPKQEEVAPPQEPPHPAATAEKGGHGNRFPLHSLVKFVIGAVAILVLLLIVWGIGSLLFAPKNTNGKINLVYWGLWESPNVMQPIIDNFEKQHPNITITYTKEDPQDYTKRLLTRMQDGNGPDIFRLHNTWVYPLQSVLLPLPSEVISKQDLNTIYPPVVTKDMVINGAVYGLPLEMDTLSLFVNDDIFNHAGAKVPETWDNFITVAKALTVKDPSGHIQTAGAAIGTYDNITHAPDLASLLFLQNGADLQKLGSSNAVDALSFYTSFASPPQNIWDNTLDSSLNTFASGKAAMYFGYSYDIFAIQAANPQLHFSIHPVPHLPGRNMTIASYWVEGVSNRSQHPKEALAFLQYLAQKDTQTQLYTQEAQTRSFGELYARTDLASELSANPFLAPFITQYAGATSSFFVDNTDYTEYNGALNQYLGNALNSILKDTSANSAAQTLQQGVTQVLSTYAPQPTH